MVWAVATIAPDDVVERLAALLSPDESARAARFLFEHHRRSFTVARGMLRVLLASLSGVPAREVLFSYESKGKPRFANDSRIRFNVSHSHELALFAFAQDTEIGVDVEYIRSPPDIGGIAKRFFCPEEAAELATLSEPDRVESFFRCWTRKEAYIKAIGEGLSEPLHRFRVSLRAGQPAQFLHIGHDAAVAADWQMHHLEPAPGYVGALAYRGRKHRIDVCQNADPSAFLK